MKKQLTTWIALAASTIILAGCNNTQSNSKYDQQIYSSVMAKGDQAVQHNDYDAADAYYQAALTAKKGDTKAQTYAQQAQNIKNAQKAMEHYSFAEAKNRLKDVKDNNGSAKMQQKANQLLKTIATVENHRKDYRQQVEAAATANDSKKYAEAQKSIVALLEKTDFHKKYYNDLYKQANEILITSVKNLKTSEQTPTTSSTADSNQPSNNKDSQQIGEGDIVKNPTVHGNKITTADIQKARKQLRDQGAQEAAASDSDIIRAIQKAAAQGRTTVTPDDAGF